MSHHIYRTEAIVLQSFPEGESNRFIYLFTRELGLIGGSARSIRDGKSKLRYALEDYSIATVSLVRGKGVWRITNAVPISNAYRDLAGDRMKLIAGIKILGLVRKLVRGEGKHGGLYAMLIESLRFLKESEISNQELVSFQLIAALRILGFLGYAAHEASFARIIEAGSWSPELLSEFAPFQRQASQATAAALTATHL